MSDNPNATVDDLIYLQFSEIDRCIARQRKIFEMLLQYIEAQDLTDQQEQVRGAGLSLTRLQEARHWLEECER